MTASESSTAHPFEDAPKPHVTPTVVHDPILTKTDFKSVGTRPLRPDGLDKVTGRARYGADFNLPGQLIGLVLRSPHAHARIKKIDTSKAEKLAGVKAVITSADLPDNTNGDQSMYDILENCMARGKAMYDGHAVAAVAAVDAAIARQALKLIKVEYEVLPHVTDVDEAVKPSAPVLNPDIFTEGVEPKPKKASNIAKRTEFGHGDVEAGFKECRHRHRENLQDRTDASRLYRAPRLSSPMFRSRRSRAKCGSPPRAISSIAINARCLLGMDISKLRVTASEIGGGFGGKTHIWAEPVALALSRKANRPVKLTS